MFYSVAEKKDLTLNLVQGYYNGLLRMPEQNYWIIFFYFFFFFYKFVKLDQ